MSQSVEFNERTGDIFSFMCNNKDELNSSIIEQTFKTDMDSGVRYEEDGTLVVNLPTICLGVPSVVYDTYADVDLKPCSEKSYIMKRNSCMKSAIDIMNEELERLVIERKKKEADAMESQEWSWNEMKRYRLSSNSDCDIMQLN